MNPLDRVAIWYLIRRRMLIDLKTNPLRIAVPFPLSEAEAKKLRDEWTRWYG